MPAACYKGLSGREDFPWFCNNCLSKTLNCISEVKSIEERCNEFMNKFEEQVNSRIDKVKHNLDKYSNSIKIPDIQISNHPSPSKVISQATKEVQSRVDRRNNILHVVFSVPESESHMKDQVQNVVIEDTNIFLELCNIVEAGAQESDIGTMKRIGKTNQKR